MPISNDLEHRFARVQLELPRDDVDALVNAPIGPVIVGEAPGDNTSVYLPMFPWPRNSAGGRLMAFSRMAPLDYLRTFHRINLMREPRGWSAASARAAAHDVLMEYGGHPLVLMGSKVAAAFGRDVRILAAPDPAWTTTCWTIPLPHPSGRNLVTNDEGNRERMRRALWLAADLWTYPLGSHTRASCDVCGQLVSTHQEAPGTSGVRRMCQGSSMAHMYARTRHDAYEDVRRIDRAF